MRITRFLFWLFLSLLGIGLASCRFSSPEPRFTLLAGAETGVRFRNQLTESDSLSILRFEYLYNGGGVGVGDFNGDGQPDLFFAGNQVSSQLYLNRGDWHFDDVTAAAGVGTTAWCTGVAVVDLNADGRPDLHVSTANPVAGRKTPNLVFINRGNDAHGTPRFEEVAARLGLADSSYCSQAAFLDYDRDGDLDCYLLTNAAHEPFDRNGIHPFGPRNDGTSASNDRLYRNDGPGPDGLPRFTDVSRAAGLRYEGWGLGVVVSDFNGDGWPDLYVANDFLSNDNLLVNNRNGTFSDQINRFTKHQSHNSMGVDAADVNNDGLPDLVVMDMLPDDNLRQKTMFGSIGYDRFTLSRGRGYNTQYVRNTLQVNRGRVNDSTWAFSEVGYLAGVAATDWSWSALLADFDNDGLRDLFVTNGYAKDVTDLDFVAYNREAGMFGTDAERLKRVQHALQSVPGVLKPPFLFRNGGNLTFTNVAPDWGLTRPAYANGAAYADLDGDGDLDLVTNNLNGEAFLARNNTVTPEAKNARFLILNLLGEGGNHEGLGAKIDVFWAGKRQFAEYQRQRGYQSSVADGVHFGLGNTTQLDSVRIAWPDGRGQVLRHVPTNRRLTVRQSDAHADAHAWFSPPNSPPIFRDVTAASGVHYRPDEDEFVDYKAQAPLLPQKYSQGGPALAVGDVNGDGLDDFAVGGPARRSAKLFFQRPDGTFRMDSLPAKPEEDMGLLLFDADRDGDLDLYAVSGSSEFGPHPERYQDRLYRNDGKGHFQRAEGALPAITASGSCVTASDFDHDGDFDLFIGGRIVPGQYPLPARSCLLRNDGTEGRPGHFTDVTDRLAPGLAAAGLVTAAVWSDWDNDGWADLLVVGEWMPLTVFKNQKGILHHALTPSLNHSTGWWNSLVAADFDNDGDVDYVAGNLGRNSRLQASAAQPVCVYARDYDGNGTLDPVLCRYVGGREVPVHPRETLTDQMVSLKKKLTTYAGYGRMTAAELLPDRETGFVRRATCFESVYFANQRGKLVPHPLPLEAQFAPLFGLQPVDFDGDGNLDLLGVGNSYASEVLSGWYDAGIGVCLRGNGRGGFTPVPVEQSGFFVNTDAKALVQLRGADGAPRWVVSSNQDWLKVFSRRKSVNNPAPVPPKRKTERYVGAGYLSQSGG